MRKKGQTEIIGLAIVVILIIVGMAFVIRFMINQDPSDSRPGFVQAELASNMINTFLETTSNDCKGLSMTELLQDCSQAASIQCDTGERSCQYVERISQEIFAETLDAWNMDYYYIVYQDIANPIMQLGEACPGDRRSKTFPIPRRLFVRLDVCG